MGVVLLIAGLPQQLRAEEALPAIPKSVKVPGEAPGALSAENLAKKRPKPAFDLTGNWMFSPAMNGNNGVFAYLPLPKLTPAAQAIYDASKAANATGKNYKNDEGQCWPAGMPESMTRVWPNQTIQLPTVIIMTQMLKHEIRWIYIDGRSHADPDIKPASYSGDSIGHFEGDTLVVETTNLQPKHHWIMTGIPVGPKLKIIERIKLKDHGNILEDTFTMTDPDNWVGEWVNTKYWYRHDDTDPEEAFCLPDINDDLLSTHDESNVR
ncbi:MAG: hypothetical protein WA825_12920 [Steroidobacteraceae bacterium]